MWSKTFALLLLVISSTASAGTMYCCQDPSSGRRVCGDTVPEQCRGQAYRVIDSQGNIVREVAAPMTAEQRVQKDLETKRRKEYEELQREQRRRDAALLETYNGPQEIDRARARAEEDVAYEIRQAEKRIAEAANRRHKFEEEAEFYKKKEIPAAVAKGLRDADNELAAQKNLLATKQRDLETVRAKFAEDKRRYLEIVSGRGTLGIHPGAAAASKAQGSR